MGSILVWEAVDIYEYSNGKAGYFPGFLILVDGWVVGSGCILCKSALVSKNLIQYLINHIVFK